MLIKIREWLYVGNNQDCNESDIFGAVIHIWRSDIPQNSCNFKQHNLDFKFDYKDGESLSTELDKLSEIIKNFKEKSQKMLIHCHAGLTRSPTVILFALSLIENTHPLNLLGEVYRKMWLHEILANIVRTPLKDIIDYFESKR